jgi:hypothetical protein
MESLPEMRPSVLDFSTSFFVMAEVTQLVTEFAFPLVMVFLVARCFTKELVNSKIPHYPPYIPSKRRIVG